MSAPDRYAVIGHPISHSRSPLIHRLFAQQCQQHMVYSAVDVPPLHVSSWVTDFFAASGRGLNVTVPHKQALLTIPSRLTERARVAGALNTLALDAAGKLLGDNTDGIGLLRDLTDNLGVTIAGQRLLMLGAGGAARGVLAPLLEMRPAQLVIANRSEDRAGSLASGFTDFGAVRACGYSQLGAAHFDLIINATAAGLAGEVPPLPAGVLSPRGTVCYDMSYGEGDTPFVRWAHEHGVTRAFNGLGMLAEQAAESFHLWRGMRPDTAAVRTALGAALKTPD
jgi:shikimate dehydrogenase